MNNKVFTKLEEKFNLAFALNSSKVKIISDCGDERDINLQDLINSIVQECMNEIDPSDDLTSMSEASARDHAIYILERFFGIKYCKKEKPKLKAVRREVPQENIDEDVRFLASIEWKTYDESGKPTGLTSTSTIHASRKPQIFDASDENEAIRRLDQLYCNRDSTEILDQIQEATNGLKDESEKNRLRGLMPKNQIKLCASSDPQIIAFEKNTLSKWTREIWKVLKSQ